MDPYQILTTLLLGGLMGLLGQGARAVVGLKSMTDDATTLGVSSKDLFQAARLLTSLLIGVLVGIAAALTFIAGGGKWTDLDWHHLIGFAAAAYGGTDILEAFISKYLVPPTQTTALTLGAAQMTNVAAPTAPASQPTTPKELVYSVILQLEPNEQITDDRALADLGYDDFASKDVLRWAINKRHWHGLSLPTGALANCTKVSDVTQVVASAGKPKPPQAGPA